MVLEMFKEDSGEITGTCHLNCRKISYETKSEASKHAKQLKVATRYRSKQHKRKVDSGKALTKLKPYLCPFCTKWHLTSTTIHKRKAKATAIKEKEKAKLVSKWSNQSGT